jgi:type I restriction enzyme, S subunit
LRFPEFTDEWQKKKLGDILQFKNGINAAKEQYGKGVKFVNVSDILNNEFLTYDNIIGSVDIDHTTHTRYLVEYGDILFQRSSETREEVGTANVYLDNDRTATFGGFVIRGKKIGDYNPIFFNNLLKTSSSRNSITSKSGGSTRYNVGQETLNSVELFFPQIPEQNKIASLLQLLNQRIQTQNKILRELIVLKSSFAKKIFELDLFFKNEMGFSYDEWKEMKLREVVNINMGQSPESSSYNLENVGYPLIQGNADIVDRVSDPRQYTSKPKKFCEIGDILLTVRAPVGYVARSKHNACIGRGVCSIKIKGNTQLEYVYQFLQYFEMKWKSLEQGSTFTAVNSSDIGSITIMIPSVLEQKKIVNFLSAIDKKIVLEKCILEVAEKQKKKLLSQLFV